MNCDTAFDLITDVHGRHSAALREHLEGCPRCRQMLETLSPALETLGDEASAIDPSNAPRPDSYDWNRTSRETSAESVAVAHQAAYRLAGTEKALARRWQGLTRGAVRCALAFTVGACAAFLLLPRIGDDASRHGSMAVPVSDGHCTRQRLPSDFRGMTDEAAQQLVLSCMVCHVPAR